MSIDVEAAGDVITGAVIASTLQPAGGTGAITAANHQQRCANCQTELQGHYCHACGQRSPVHRTLAAYGHDILHGVFHLDGKFWRTIPLLLFRPGELTRRYVHGERARFLSPLALFLFSVFLLFAVVKGFNVGPFDFQSTTTRNGKVLNASELQVAVSAARDALSQLRAQRVAAEEIKADVSELDEKLVAAEEELRSLSIGAVTKGDFETGTLTDAAKIDTGSGTADALIKRAIANPSLVIYKIQSNAYKFSWALIPMSLPLVWLLFFWRREFKLYDHAVFVTHSITFVTLLFVLLSTMRFAGAPDAVTGTSLMVLPPLHIYRHLRGAYGIRRLSAIVRMLLLLLFAAIVLLVFAALLTVLGLLGS
jgi:hypothetical protein